jgi:hypothetical protein
MIADGEVVCCTNNCFNDCEGNREQQERIETLESKAPTDIQDGRCASLKLEVRKGEKGLILLCLYQKFVGGS